DVRLVGADHEALVQVLVDLLVDRAHDSRAPVAEVLAGDAAAEVEVLATLAVPDPGTPGARDDELGARNAPRHESIACLAHAVAGNPIFDPHSPGSISLPECEANRVVLLRIAQSACARAAARPALSAVGLARLKVGRAAPVLVRVLERGARAVPLAEIRPAFELAGLALLDDLAVREGCNRRARAGEPGDVENPAVLDRDHQREDASCDDENGLQHRGVPCSGAAEAGLLPN